MSKIIVGSTVKIIGPDMDGDLEWSRGSAHFTQGDTGTVTGATPSGNTRVEGSHFRMSFPRSSLELVTETTTNSTDTTHSHHSSHYASNTIEPIDILEQIAENLRKTDLTPSQCHNLLQAGKYLLRLGTKDSAKKELDKFHNYAERAYTGKWRGQ